jgi:SAM-dependent methyltransferase
MISALRGKVNANARIILEDYNQTGWLKLISDLRPFDLVISGFSIHHLEDADKKKLYSRIYDLLKAGGLFLNLEHVSSVGEKIEKVHDAIFIDAITAFHEGKKSREVVEREYVHREDKILNRLAPVELQCDWLKDIGFTQVDCYFKFFELALFGGLKPA